jgi:integrase
MKQKPLRLKGINRVKFKLASGAIKVCLYHRASGERLDEGDLVQSFAAAERKMRTRGQGTMLQLIRKWDTNNPVFDALSAETRDAYKWKLKAIEKKWGGVPVAAFNDADDALEFRKDALAWHKELGLKSRRSADNLLSALARVLSFAKGESIIKFNPIDTFERLYKSDRAGKIWSDDLVKTFWGVARPSMVTAMYLVRNIGQRAGDLRRLPWTAYNGVTIKLRQSKGGSLIEVPCPIELKTYLDSLTRVGLLILTTPTGKAYTKRYFNEHWREDADLAGAGDLNFHDNRGTAATHLAEAGANSAMIASIMGWKIERAQKIIDTYIARSSALAAAGIKLLEAHREKQNG